MGDYEDPVKMLYGCLLIAGFIVGVLTVTIIALVMAHL